MKCAPFAVSPRAVQVTSTTVPIAPRSCAAMYPLVLVVSSMAAVSRALVQVESSHGGNHSPARSCRLRTDVGDVLDACNRLRIVSSASRGVGDRLFVVRSAVRAWVAYVHQWWRSSNEWRRRDARRFHRAMRGFPLEIGGRTSMITLVAAIYAFSVVVCAPQLGARPCRPETRVSRVIDDALRPKG